MSADESHEELIDRLAESFAERYRGGQCPSVDQYVERYPEIAAEVREAISALVLLEEAGPGVVATAAHPADAPPTLERLGEFRIIREIARGGMGVVYEAEQESLGRRVALKVLPRQMLRDEKHRQRFRREAKAAARLHHTHIVPVFAVGQQDGMHYYAMQFIHGQSLDEVLVELKRLARGDPDADDIESAEPFSAASVAHSLLTGQFRRTQIASDSDESSSQRPGEAAAEPQVPNAQRSTLNPADTATGHLSDTVTLSGSATLPGQGEAEDKSSPKVTYWQSVARICIQAAEALEYAHGQGILHRDVKPGNLLLDTAGVVWMTDFGLAKAEDQQDLTATGDIVGTLRYMAPEAFQHRSDERSDVYTLGLTLYELLALRPAFDESDRARLMRQVMHDTLPRLHTVNKAIPSDLALIVEKATARDPSDRYRSARELAEDLERFLGDEPILARRPPMVQRLGKWIRRHKPLVGGVAAVVLISGLILGGSIGWIARDRAARLTAVKAETRLVLEKAAEFEEQGRWPQALETARHASSLLASAGASDSAMQNVAERVMLLELIERLERIRTEGKSQWVEGQFNRAGADREYAIVFGEYGIDPEDMESLKPVRAQTESIRIALAAALDDWAESRRRSIEDEQDDASWQHLVMAAGAIDPDPWRDRLREAWSERDTETLLELAESVAVAELPRATVSLLARALSNAERYEAAHALLRTAQRIHPDDFWVNLTLPVVAAELKKPDESVRFAAVAVALRPDNPVVHNNLGSALCEHSEIDEAIAAYREAIRIDPEFAVPRYNLGVVLGEQGQFDEAIAAYREAIRIDPESADAYINLGNALHDRGQVDQAIAAYREAIRIDPAEAIAHYNLGNALREQGQLDEAIAAYREAIRIAPEYASPHNDLGVALREQGQLDEAIAAYREAIQIDPEYAIAHNNLGNALRDQGQLDEAIAAHHEASRLDPDNGPLHNNLGIALFDQGQLDKAIAVHREAIRLDPKYARAHHSLGNALLNQGQLDEAIAAYREAVRLDPELFWAYGGLGTALRDQGQLDAAIAAYRQALHLDPGYNYGHTNLRIAIRKKSEQREEKPHEFLSDAESNEFNDGRNPWVTDYVRFLAYRVEGDWSGAAEAFAQAVERGATPAYVSELDQWPPSGNGWFLEGMIASAATKTEDYRRICGQLLEEYGRSDDPPVAALIVWCCKLRPNAVQDLEAIIRLGERTLTKLPGNYRLKHDLGGVLYRAGRFEQAVEYIQEAGERRPGQQLIHWDWLWLTMAHHRLGRTDKAERWFQKVDTWMEQRHNKQGWGKEFEFLHAEAEQLMGSQSQRSETREQKSEAATSLPRASPAPVPPSTPQ